MKTILIIICTLVLIIVFDVTAMNFIEKEMRYYEDNISSAVKNIESEDYEAALTSIERIDSKWSENEYKWNMLCDHAEIEQITILLQNVKVNYKSQAYDEVLIDLEELKCSLLFTSMRYNIVLHNII